MAAMKMMASQGDAVDLVACALSADVFAAIVAGDVDGAVLPIENSLHGSVAEHYDLLLQHAVRIVRESSLRVRHNVIALPGVKLRELRRILSHPVALSQCRRWLHQHSEFTSEPFYDTAGSVKHLVSHGLRDVAAVAPALAAEVFGGEVLVEGIEDHHENFTRFHLITREDDRRELAHPAETPTKMSVAFALEHRPGTLFDALGGLARCGADLTKIESRPVPGRPWEYVFYVDLRFGATESADEALRVLNGRSSMVKELGRYQAAEIAG